MFGATRNPWNLAHIAGGSSGGAAAAVAAGIVPVAHATDGGGSIRIPASCCGLFGLKPTRARTPMGPKRGEGWGGVSVGHVVSRSVRDSAAFLDATAGAAPGDPYPAPPPPRPFLDEAKTAPGRLRIAFSTKPAIPADVHPDAHRRRARGRETVRKPRPHRRRSGADINGMEIMQAQGVVISANVAFTVDEAAEALGRKARPEDVERATWFRVENARKTRFKRLRPRDEHAARARPHGRELHGELRRHPATDRRPTAAARRRPQYGPRRPRRQCSAR